MSGPPTLMLSLRNMKTLWKIPLVANVAFGFDISNDQIILNSTTTFFDGTSGDFWVNAFILENGIEYEQKIGDDYVTVIGERISRGTFVPTQEEMWGENIASGNIEEGTSFNSYFSRDLPAEWNADSLEFIVAIWQKLNDTTYYALSAEDQPYDYVVDIKETAAEKKTIYPNPASDQLTIGSGTALTSVEIIGVAGNLIRSYENINTSSFTIQVANLERGMYFVRMRGEEGSVAIRKVILN